MTLYQLQKPLFTALIISWVAVSSLFWQRSDLRSMIFYGLILIVYGALVHIIRGIEPTDRIFSR